MAAANARPYTERSCWPPTTAAPRRSKQSATSVRASRTHFLKSCTRHSRRSPSTSRNRSTCTRPCPRTSPTSGSSRSSCGRSRPRISRSAPATRLLRTRSGTRARASRCASRGISGRVKTKSPRRRRRRGRWRRCIGSKRVWPRRMLQREVLMMIGSIRPKFSLFWEQFCRLSSEIDVNWTVSTRH